MKSRLARYNNNSNTQSISRMSKNKHLYDELNNKIGFEELVNFDTQTRIELTSLDNTRQNRERYHQLKDYKNFISDDNRIQNIPIEKEQEKNFDINSILEEARKNRTDIDELEKKRKLKNDDYSILSDLNKKYLSKEKDEYEGLEELINTITSKTLASEIKEKEESEEKELLSDLLATSVDLQVQIPEKYEKIEYNDINENTEETEKEVDDSFYTKSMDLSEYDFEGFGYNKKNNNKTIIIIVIIIILLIIVSVVAFFTLKKLQII